MRRTHLFRALVAATALTTLAGCASSASGGSSGSKSLVALYQAGISVPSFELDLFGRLRSLSHAQLERYFATEAGARATRLTLVADIANAWLNHAADSSLLLVSQQTVASAQKSGPATLPAHLSLERI